MLHKTNISSPWLKEFYEKTPESERRLAAITAEIGSYINSLLKEKDLTQKQLAEKMKVKPSVVSRLLQGNQNTTLKTLASVEAALQEGIVLTPKLAHMHPVVRQNFWAKGDVKNMIQKPFASSNIVQNQGVADYSNVA